VQVGEPQLHFQMARHSQDIHTYRDLLTTQAGICRARSGDNATSDYLSLCAVVNCNCWTSNFWQIYV